MADFESTSTAQDSTIAAEVVPSSAPSGPPPSASVTPVVSRRVWLGAAAATVAAASAATVAAMAPADPRADAQTSSAVVPAPTQRRPTVTAAPARRLPTIYLPHGAGPCFFMDWTMGSPDTWKRTAAWLRSIPNSLGAEVKALLVISAHWETDVVTVTAAEKHPLLFDYSGFPKHTYALTWPVPSAPKLAAQVLHLLKNAGIAAQAEHKRGLDHGVFIPLKVAFPSAKTPVIQLSLRRGLDPAAHLAIGRALAPLRAAGVLIIGSGMSYHNMRGFGQRTSLLDSQKFDGWLSTTVQDAPERRDAQLLAWKKAPAARACHPREEHLLPLMVVVGAAGKDRGVTVFRDVVMGVQVAAHRFG